MKKGIAFFICMLCCLTPPLPGAFAGEEIFAFAPADGKPLGGVRLERGALTGFEKDGDGAEFSFTTAQEGFYDVIVTSSGQGGHKENYIYMDGVYAGLFASEAGAAAPSALERVYLTAGEHTLTLLKYWGWIKVTGVEIRPSAPLPKDIYDVSPELVNPDASENARRLMAYLCDQYGQKIITGQFCEQGMYGLENAAVWRVTGGRYPAILGMDLMDYSPSRTERGTVGKTVDLAIDYWNKGGVVAFCWHWNAPSPYLTGTWYSGFYTEHTSLDLGKIMNGQDEAGCELLLRDIDVIAKELQRLRDAGVPVLWRPLHEASGGWFWWGASGPEAYVKLYRLLFDKMTGEYGLNNLIWVWNGQDAAWYPGDEYVDIIGEDVYPGERVYSSQSAVFLKALSYTDTRKMIVLSENGCMPDPDLLFRDGTVWGSYCTWEGDFVLAAAGMNKWSERYTEAEMVRKIYADPRVIARDDLPDLTSYPLPEERKGE